MGQSGTRGAAHGLGETAEPGGWRDPETTNPRRARGQLGEDRRENSYSA